MGKKISTIGVLTSGGDSPGMNAAIRAIVRSAISKGIKVVGIRRGFGGIISGEMFFMDRYSVSDIIQRGGTILQSSRFPEFVEPEVQLEAAKICRTFGIDGLIVIGGDGTFRGAEKLSDLGVKTIAVPGTIDMDVACTDYTIGFDTAVNTVMDAVNKIRDTSTSHMRCSLVEVMGRHSGYIALWSALNVGAELVILPERPIPSDDYVIRKLLNDKKGGKQHFIIIIAEGVGGVTKLSEKIERVAGIEARVTILGHLQRGGAPTALDRMHASMMGVRALELLVEGKTGRVVAYKMGDYVDYDINEALEMEKNLDEKMYEVNKMLL